jgi:acetyl esterase/lipase
VAVIYFILSASMLVFVVNATRPPWTDKPTALRPAWLPVMLTNELAPLLLAAMIALNAIAALLDVLRQPLGVLGFVASVGSMALLGWMVALGIRTRRTMEASLPSTSTHRRRRVDWKLALWPQPYRIPAGVEVSEDHEYMQGQHLDLYRSDSVPSTKSPVLVHVHGGSWSGGNRKQQARPLIHAMALRGWVVAAIDYPLVPVATFPDPIVAVHNAIGWIRSHAADLGVDPAQIYVTGGSSGAHLAALAALTDMNSEWTTRNEIDPPVAGAVVFYGVFDLLNRSEIRDDWPIIPEGLIKADPKVDPQKFEVASPIDWVHRDAPPFVIVHGRQDSLVPCAESSLFASALAQVSRNPVDLVLLRGASHSFDSVPSVRTQQVVAAVGDWLDDLVRRSSADDLQ